MSVPISPIKWAIGPYASSSTSSIESYERSLLNNPEYTVVWVNIVKLMQKTDTTQRLNLTGDGGPNAKKGRVEFLKAIALKGEAMAPADVTITARGLIGFNNGRHRILVCYLLGGQKAPIIVKLSELDKLGNILEYQEITHFAYFSPKSIK